ncbi:MAG: hypothetical protein AAF408_10950 [Pseudomonadota bacterium]
MSDATHNNGPRRLIIHCGVQKTATTAFHHFVQKNRGDLPGNLEILTPQKGTLTREVGRLCGLYSLEPRHKDQLGQQLSNLRHDLLQASGTCVISHENIPGAMLGRAGVTTLYPMFESIIAILQEHLAPMLPEFVVYTRDMPSWKASVYNQAVKSDGYSKSYNEFLTETADCGSWASLLARIEKNVGQSRVRFFNLEDEEDASRPGSQLLRHVGLSQRQILNMSPVSGRRNESLNTGSLEFQRLLNSLDLPKTVLRPVRRLVQTNQSLFAKGEGAS